MIYQLKTTNKLGSIPFVGGLSRNLFVDKLSSRNYFSVIKSEIAFEALPFSIEQKSL